jgi:hypothetical protein
MISEILRAQVKRKLNITWDDPDTTARLEEIINSAIPSLIHRLGITDSNFDFSEAGQENTLFLNYCFYEWNHALPDFDENYKQLIVEVQRKWRVKEHLAESGGVNEEESV